VSSEALYMSLSFFFGFVDEDLDPFGAALERVGAFVDLDSFVALALFVVAALTPFGADGFVEPF